MRNSILVLFAGLSVSATALTRDCDMANRIQCPLDLQKNRIEVGVHNSGRPGYCAIEILTNRNHVSGTLRGFAEGLQASLGGGSGSLSILQHRNGLKLTDTSADPEGTLPPMFIVPIVITTKTGESLAELAQRTIPHHSFEPPLSLAILTVDCPAREF